MKRFLGPALAALAATMLVALTAGQALAANVSCGDTITKSTTLDSNLNCSGDGITIGADNVTLDLGGHTISGQGGNGVSVPYASTPTLNIEVRNGVLENFEIGVSINNVDGALIHDLTVHGGGIECSFGSRCTIEHNTITEGRIASGGGSNLDAEHNVLVGGGIFKGPSGGGIPNTISDNYIENAGSLGIAVTHGGASVLRNVVRNSGEFGLWLESGGGEVMGNMFVGSQRSGIVFGGLTGATVTSNVIRSNGEHGIVMGNYSGATISHNVISGNRLDGVHIVAADLTHAVPRPTVSDNQADHNGGDGIRTNSPYAALSGNHTWFNSNLGIEAPFDTLGGGNWAKHNGNPAQCVPVSLCSTTGRPR